MLDAFARNRHQAEIVKLENLGGCAIAAQRFFQRLHDFLAITALVHVDEVNDDDAAQIAQADLADNLLDRIYVGFDDRVFQARGLADVLAGIDIDGDQRLGLIDHDVAAALQPDFRFQGFVDFVGQAELLK